ncbi:MAG: Hsp20/alpha crystallin family protein [Bacteroidales bacterium]
MNLFKWNPNKKPKFPNVIEKFFGRNIFSKDKDVDVATVPSVNISDANKAFEVNIALPGLDKKDVKIEIDNNCLIISSEKQYENEEKQKNWIRREFGYASFQRAFQLPEEADPDKVQAEMKNGVLSIKVGKLPGYESKVKQIAVK